MCHRQRQGKLKQINHKNYRDIEVKFLHSSFTRSCRPSSNLFGDGFDVESESRPNLVSPVSLSYNQQAFRLSPLGRALHCCKKNAFNSICLVFRVEPLRLIIPSAVEESKNKICCVVSLVSSALHPNFNNHFHCCRRLQRVQQPTQLHHS